MADTKIGNQKSPKQAAPQAELAPREEPLMPTAEEREEELQDREAELAAREARLNSLEAKMMATMERLERQVKGQATPEDEEEAPVIVLDAQGKPIPHFDRRQPHGTVIGDADAGYVQNGHRFAKDGRYLCEEPRGTGKPFNIALLGVVKVAKAA